MRQCVLSFVISIAGVSFCAAQIDVKKDSFTRDVSPSDNPGTVNNFATQLKLEKIENGFDSVQIRIWYFYELQAKGKALILSKESSKWKGVLYTFNFTRELEIKSPTVNVVSPRSGWKKYVTGLTSLQIVALPSMKDIPNMKDMVMDGTVYDVEISTRSLYRFYSYHQPDAFDKFWQAKDMVKILDLTKSELGIPWNR